MIKLTKKPIFSNCLVPNGCSFTNYLQLCTQILALVFFLSVSLVWENLRGLRENLKHKIRILVTARPAIVTEDQMDSLSFYDDVNAPSLGGDLYESIAGSILNLAKRNSSMEDMYSSVLYSPQKPVSMGCN